MFICNDSCLGLACSHHDGDVWLVVGDTSLPDWSSYCFLLLVKKGSQGSHCHIQNTCRYSRPVLSIAFLSVLVQPSAKLKRMFACALLMICVLQALNDEVIGNIIMFLDEA